MKGTREAGTATQTPPTKRANNDHATHAKHTARSRHVPTHRQVPRDVAYAGATVLGSFLRALLCRPKAVTSTNTSTNKQKRKKETKNERTQTQCKNQRQTCCLRLLAPTRTQWRPPHTRIWSSHCVEIRKHIRIYCMHMMQSLLVGRLVGWLVGWSVGRRLAHCGRQYQLRQRRRRRQERQRR